METTHNNSKKQMKSTHAMLIALFFHHNVSVCRSIKRTTDRRHEWFSSKCNRRGELSRFGYRNCFIVNDRRGNCFQNNWLRLICQWTIPITNYRNPLSCSTLNSDSPFYFYPIVWNQFCTLKRKLLNGNKTTTTKGTKTHSLLHFYGKEMKSLEVSYLKPPEFRHFDGRFDLVHTIA